MKRKLMRVLVVVEEVFVERGLELFGPREVSAGGENDMVEREFRKD